MLQHRSHQIQIQDRASAKKRTPEAMEHRKDIKTHRYGAKRVDEHTADETFKTNQLRVLGEEMNGAAEQALIDKDYHLSYGAQKDQQENEDEVVDVDDDDDDDVSGGVSGEQSKQSTKLGARASQYVATALSMIVSKTNVSTAVGKKKGRGWKRRKKTLVTCDPVACDPVVLALDSLNRGNQDEP